MITTKQNRFQPAVENLEDRLCMSWTGAPSVGTYVNLNAAGNDRWTVSSFGTAGGFSHTQSITRQETDYLTFTALRTGSYTFRAQASGSNIDAVAALFATDGKCLASNDDSGGTRDSKFDCSLTAGKTYVFGVTNYTASAGGAYWAAITPPAISATAYDARAFDHWLYGKQLISSTGTARLSGTNLRLTLQGANSTTSTSGSHSITVQLLDINGQPAFSIVWTRSLTTSAGGGGNKSWDIDLSNYDLSKVSKISITVRAS